MFWLSKCQLHFRMSFDDFENNFTLLEICHFGYASLDHRDEIDKKKRCEEICFAGEWVANVNAGGSFNYPGNSVYTIKQVSA